MSARSFKDGRLDRWRATDSWMSSGRIDQQTDETAESHGGEGPEIIENRLLADVAETPEGCGEQQGAFAESRVISPCSSLIRKWVQRSSGGSAQAPLAVRPARAKTRMLLARCTPQKHWIRD